MKKKVQIKVTCKGTSPILMNPATEELIDSLHTGVRLQTQKDVSAEDIAKGKVIRNKDNQMGIPVEYLFACLKGAGRLVKNGKKQISTAKSTTLFALITIQETFVVFKNQNAQMKISKKKGKLPKDGTAVAIIRPEFTEWEFDVFVTVNADEIKPNIIKDVFETAGSMIGLGDFRPSCGGPYGCFAVTSWQVLEGEIKENGEANETLKKELVS